MEKFKTAQNILEKLENLGYMTYFAGGCVRDLLMGQTPDDIDIVTEASIDEIQKNFQKTHPVGIQFGIIIVVEDNYAFEIACFRKDGTYSDGRKPQFIEKATPEEDAHRRDFTINGLFYHPVKKEIIDYVNGQKDIKKKILKTIGSPNERFEEDRLRMLRACRFSACLEFTIESQTLLSMQNLAHKLFPSVSIERVWHEFQKAHKLSKLPQMCLIMLQTPLFFTVFPSLSNLSLELEDKIKSLKNFHSEFPMSIFFSLLSNSCSIEETRLFFERFKASKKEQRVALAYLRFKNSLHDYLTKKDKSLIHLLQSCIEDEAEQFFKLYALDISDPSFLEKNAPLLSRLDPHINAYKKNKPWVSPQDLIHQGIPQGPKIGSLLIEAQRIAIDENLTLKESIIEKLKKSPTWN
jgi:poly(A) polymerase